jgi:phosphoribosylglycinamide formyltransferase 2
MSVQLGTPLSASATRVLLLGSGELGKEVAVELQRLGVEVVAVDSYAGAPAMQVAHRAHVVDMLDPEAVRAVIDLRVRLRDHRDHAGLTRRTMGLDSADRG